MFRIGGFSLLSKVPVKTLRYYDQIGLLRPQKIDPSTGYRYYSAEQLFEVNRIFLYKELGFTLKQTAELLHEEISLDQMEGMFKLKESEIQQLLEREQEKLNRIKERMHLIRREGIAEKEQEVVIKTVERTQMIVFRAHGSVEDIPLFFETAHHLLDQLHVEWVSDTQMVLWRESAQGDSDFEFEVGYAFKGKAPTLPDGLILCSLPEEATMATLLFHSKSSFAQTACVDLATWIENNGYRVKADQPGREIYLPLSEDHDDRLIEIQIPIEGS